MGLAESFMANITTTLNTGGLAGSTEATFNLGMQRKREILLKSHRLGAIGRRWFSAPAFSAFLHKLGGIGTLPSQVDVGNMLDTHCVAAE